MRNEIRILGIDDAPFDKFKDYETEIVGVLFRGGNFLDGVVSTRVDIDGTNAAGSISEMINRSRFRKQIKCTFLDGIAVGGFNVINIKELHEKTGIGVIVIMRKYPDEESIHKALIKLNMENKIPLLKLGGKIHKHVKIHFQTLGFDTKTARELINIATTHSDIPEPIRVAHLIAQGTKLGESKGRA